jgi:hypothetical protein
MYFSDFKNKTFTQMYSERKSYGKEPLAELQGLERVNIRTHLKQKDVMGLI